MSPQTEELSASDQPNSTASQGTPEAQTDSHSNRNHSVANDSSSPWDLLVIGGLFFAYVIALIGIGVFRAVKGIVGLGK
jgi:putative IMPACT (imprinted ancient) family translation regulator